MGQRHVTMAVLSFIQGLFSFLFPLSHFSLTLVVLTLLTAFQLCNTNTEQNQRVPGKRHWDLKIVRCMLQADVLMKKGKKRKEKKLYPLDLLIQKRMLVLLERKGEKMEWNQLQMFMILKIQRWEQPTCLFALRSQRSSPSWVFFFFFVLNKMRTLNL